MTYTTHADLGGTLSHGRVVPEPEDEVFHAEWEGKVLALVLAMGAAGKWNIDLSRSARETLPDYLDLSYYEIWHHALVKQLDEVGLAGLDELLDDPDFATITSATPSLLFPSASSLAYISGR